MPELRLTSEQEAAIQHEGHNILVSASAGSGKTFVMANRIVRKLKMGVPLSSLFISTFTKKAAAELKTRLEKDIKKARQAAEDEETAFLLSQALHDLPSSDIGTMDSFTQKLLREHFNVVNIDPNFRILADQTESDLMKAEVFEEILESYLLEAEDIPDELKIEKYAFEKLIKNFSKDRNVKGFQEVVYMVYSFAMATEEPISWIKNELPAAYQKYRKFTDLPEETGEIAEQLEDLFTSLQLAVDEENLTGKTLEKALLFLDSQNAMLSALENKDYQTFSEVFASLDFQRWSLKKDEVLEGRFKKTIGTGSAPGLVRNFIKTVKFVELIEKYQPEAEALVKDLQKFSLQFYSQFLGRKLEENVLEYGDVSHFAIRVLAENPEIAAAYREKFNEIMIDEYQDTSHTQEAMLRLLSKHGDGSNNLFMVGDIKQSIYGFRLADPSLFYSKYKLYQEENEHELIRLKENFRSRGEVLSFTNKIFQHLMDEKIGEMTYGDEEMLLQGNRVDYPSELDEAYLPELLLYQEEKAIGDEETVSDGEIKIAAERILELLKLGVKAENIAVLVRSKTSNNKIEDVFKSYDIPVVLDEGRVDFLKSIEVMLMLDVLRAIDNPLNDIPLVALMRSPIFNFNEDELTRIALQNHKNGKFWQRVNAEQDDLIDKKLSIKVDNFVNQFTAWRKLSNEIPVEQLLWKIYVDSYYYDYVGALQNGEMRQANLQALSSRAKAYESTGYKGIYRFIKLIDSFMSQNNDLASVNIKLPQHAVRVMTFHKSKGLEFEHVFVMNIQSKFNMQDLHKSAILTRKNGIGIQYTADFKQEPGVETAFPYALVQMETFPYQLNREEKRLSSLSEEMRVLYVALTRAKEKLYLVGKLKEKTLDAFLSVELKQGILSDDFRKSENGFQHWILALSEAVDLPMKMKIIRNEELSEGENIFQSKPNFEKLLKESVKFDGVMEQSEAIKQAKAIMDYDYPYLAATQLASIQTPSQVKKRAYEKQLEVGNVMPSSEFVATKKLGLNEHSSKLSAAEIGTATHNFMQLADFSQPDLFSFQQTLDEMKISDELKDKIDIAKILTLFDDDFGQLLVKHVDATVKEAPFSMLRTDPLAEDQYIVRGICDGFIKLEDRIVLFDYKTDRFKALSEIDEIMERYRLQMDLYAEALRKAYAVNEVDKFLVLLGGPEKVWVKKYEL